MPNMYFWLLLLGFALAAFGTLIGAGGGQADHPWPCRVALAFVGVCLMIGAL